MQLSTQHVENRYTEVTSRVTCRDCGTNTNTTVAVDQLAGVAGFRCPACGKQQEA